MAAEGKRVSPDELGSEQRAEYSRLNAIAIANRHLEEADLLVLRERAKQARGQFKHKPGRDELLSPEEQANSAPFYFALRVFIKQLKNAREAAGLTLAQVAEKTKLAEETLCRLESGAVTNPTWRTLGLYAVAVDLDMNLTATPPKRKRK